MREKKQRKHKKESHKSLLCVFPEGPQVGNKVFNSMRYSLLGPVKWTPRCLRKKLEILHSGPASLQGVKNRGRNWRIWGNQKRNTKRCMQTLTRLPSLQPLMQTDTFPPICIWTGPALERRTKNKHVLQSRALPQLRTVLQQFHTVQRVWFGRG